MASSAQSPQTAADDRCQALSRADEITFDPFSTMSMLDNGVSCRKFGRFAVLDKYGVERLSCSLHVAQLMEEAGTSDAWSGDSIAVRLVDTPVLAAKRLREERAIQKTMDGYVARTAGRKSS